MVIGGQFHLTAKVFSSLSVVPDLVFLNACHVGQIPNRDLTGVNRGRRAWPSRSSASACGRSSPRMGRQRPRAKAFATTLYSELLDGRHLGEAVFSARQEASGRRTSLTWGRVPVLRRSRLPARGPAHGVTPAPAADDGRAAPAHPAPRRLGQ
jgi:hypothetical protein